VSLKIIALHERTAKSHDPRNSPAEPSSGLCVVVRTASVNTSIRAPGGSRGPAKDAMAASVPVKRQPEFSQELLGLVFAQSFIPNENAPLPSALGSEPILISTDRISVALRPSFRLMKVDEDAMLFICGYGLRLLAFVGCR
jgi:hypothetical protein